MQSRHRTSAIAVLASLTLAGSCTDLVGSEQLPTAPGSLEQSPRGGTPGSSSDSTPASSAIYGVVRIVTSTTGTDLDPDGYTVLLEPSRDTPPVAIADSGSAEMRLPAGTYVLRLSGVAGNCAVEAVAWWGMLREVGVEAGTKRDVTFEVACRPIPSVRPAPGAQLGFVRDGQIWLVGSDGTGAVQLTSGPGDADPSWSPDGRRIAFARQEGQDRWGTWLSAIYLMDADGTNLVRLTQASYDRHPTWSPDGQRIAYASRCGGAGCVLIASVDPADTSRTRIGSLPAGSVHSPAWSPDGTRLAFTSDWAFYDDASDVYLADVGSSAITQLTVGFSPPTPTNMYFAPAWSPDGARLSMTRCADGFWICDVGALVVMNADGTGERFLIATRGGADPSWSPDGQTIAFTNAGSIEWISADGSARGIIVQNGAAPAWRRR